MIESFNLEELITTYVIPWSINIGFALIIFLFGKMVVRFITGILKKILLKAKMDDILVNFVVRPWVKSADYWATKFDLTEKIKLAFDANNISIPYPQMDVNVNHLKSE